MFKGLKSIFSKVTLAFQGKKTKKRVSRTAKPVKTEKIEPEIKQVEIIKKPKEFEQKIQLEPQKIEPKEIITIKKEPKAEIKKITKPIKIDITEKGSEETLWKEQANSAEKIKRAFQGFFYDVAGLESLNNQPELKKNTFEEYKKSFKFKIEQNFIKLDEIDQQIFLVH